MRVAYVCADAGVPVFGTKGASIHVQAILRSFVRRGDHVDLYSARAEGEVPVDLAAVAVHSLLPRRPPSSPVGSRSIDDALAAALSERIRTYDVVYERHALWSSSAMRLACVRGVPGILEINAPLVEEQQAHRQLADPELARELVAQVLRAARLRVAVSSEVARRHVEYGFSFEDFLVCPNGVDPARFALRSAGAAAGGDVFARSPRMAPEDPFTVGFLGTLKPWHGLDVLLDAFGRLAREHSAYRLLIVGDGPLRRQIEARLARESLAPRAEFSGAVDPAEVPSWLSRMDVGTAPYAQREGLYFSPLKILEYLAAGLPVVASDAGQVRELVREGVDGWLVEPGNAADLADRLERLRRDPVGARTMGARGREDVIANRSWDSVLEGILDAVPELGEARAKLDPGPSFAEVGHG